MRTSTVTGQESRRARTYSSLGRSKWFTREKVKESERANERTNKRLSQNFARRESKWREAIRPRERGRKNISLGLNNTRMGSLTKSPCGRLTRVLREVARTALNLENTRVLKCFSQLAALRAYKPYLQFWPEMDLTSQTRGRELRV